MAYEREMIAENTSALPKAAPVEMREERVVDPYAQRRAILPAGAPANAANTPVVGQPDKSGETPAVEPAKPVETVRLSPQAAALARKELQFRQKEQKLAEQLKAIETERAEIADLKSLKSKLAADDYTGIEKLVNYEKYAQYLLNQQAAADPQAQALNEIKTELAELKNTQKKDIDSRMEAAIAQRKTAISELVSKNDQFSTIRELKREDAVIQHILDTWEHDSEELTVEQAAQEVEGLLYERAQRYAAIPKLKKTAAPESAPEAPAPEEKKALPPMKPGLKTITNQVTSGEIKKTLKPLSLMNESERYAEARRRALEKLSKQPPKPTPA